MTTTTAVTISVNRDFEWLRPTVLYETVNFVCKDVTTSAEGLALVQNHLTRIVEEYDLSPSWLKLATVKHDQLYECDTDKIFVWKIDDLRHRNVTGAQVGELMRETTIELTDAGFTNKLGRIGP